MRTTPIRLVLALVVLGGAVGWTLLAVFERWGGGVPWVPWLTPAGLLFFAALVGIGAWHMYDRVHRRREPVSGPFAVRMVVLGKAGALVGSLLAGGYAGFALRLLGRADSGGERAVVVHAFVAAGTAVLVLVAALLLERACRVPGDPDRDRDPDGDATHRSR